MKPLGLKNNFILLVKQDSDKGEKIRQFFRVMFFFALQKFFVFKDGSVEIARKVRFLNIESKRTINLLVADVDLNFGENWMQKVVNRENEGIGVYSSNSFSAGASFKTFFVLFQLLFFVVIFVTTTVDQLQFEGQKSPFWTTWVVAFLPKFKINRAFNLFIEWGYGINFLAVGEQDTLIFFLSLQGFRQMPQMVGHEHSLSLSGCNVLKRISTRPSSFGSCCWSNSPQLTTTTNLFFHCLAFHVLCSCGEIFIPPTRSPRFGAAKSNKSSPSCFETEMLNLRN